MAVNVMDPNTYMQFMFAGKADQLAWDSMGKTGMNVPVNISINSFYSKDMMNNGLVVDPTYDALVDKFNSAPTMDEAKQVLIQADQYVLQQHFAISACPTVNFTVWQPYLAGYSGEAAGGGGGSPATVARLWIDQNLKKTMGR
jgi:ABC-type transport system substrate-binding protein